MLKPFRMCALHAQSLPLASLNFSVPLWLTVLGGCVSTLVAVAGTSCTWHIPRACAVCLECAILNRSWLSLGLGKYLTEDCGSLFRPEPALSLQLQVLSTISDGRSLPGVFRAFSRRISDSPCSSSQTSQHLKKQEAESSSSDEES